MSVSRRRFLASAGVLGSSAGLTMQASHACFLWRKRATQGHVVLPRRERQVRKPNCDDIVFTISGWDERNSVYSLTSGQIVTFSGSFPDSSTYALAINVKVAPENSAVVGGWDPVNAFGTLMDPLYMVRATTYYGKVRFTADLRPVSGGQPYNGDSLDFTVRGESNLGYCPRPWADQITRYS